MNAPTFAHDVLLPRAPPGLGAGALLALVVHAGLVLALTLATQWRSQNTPTVSAELWAAVPVSAAPAPIPPPAAAPPVARAPLPTPVVAEPPARVNPPPPPKAPAAADITTEQVRRQAQQAEREKAEAARDKLEAERKRAQEQAAKAERAEKAEKAELETLRRQELDRKKAEAERKKREEKREQEIREAKAEEDRLDKQREDNLRRMMGQAGGSNPSASNTGSNFPSATQSAAPSAGYAGRLNALIRSNIVFTSAVAATATAEVEVRTASAGSIISRRLLKSSGNADWDEAVLRAIDRTATLPRDTDGRVPPVLTLVFKPRE